MNGIGAMAIVVSENPAQQVQMQNGEQASSWGSSSVVVPASEQGVSSSGVTPSAQGRKLNDRTRKAMIKRKTFFTGAKIVFTGIKDK
jgi:hypothetical protein